MRCARDRVVFAADVQDADKARELLEKLRGRVGCFKIGLELFTSTGRSFVHSISDKIPIFLDLKLHDVPTTVGRTAAVCRNMGVKYLTVHCEAGLLALEEAVRNGPDILAVTELTSKSWWGSAKQRRWRKKIKQQVRMASDAGCFGIVCPVHALKHIAKERRGLQAVTPAIRPKDWVIEGLQKDLKDHGSFWDPAQAIDLGSNMLVIGRPIRDAEDPALAADQILKEIEDGMMEIRRRHKSLVVADI